MRIYLVGGAIRDRLLGLPVRERDWVVTGATPAQMLDAGFTRDDSIFPVFRHPKTGDEHALARLETKDGSGHRGFSFDCSPDVTLEQDLARRDLSVNAIAEDSDGSLIDPFDGLDALRERRLSHITPAFAEDPLRLLRAARFAACLAHLGFRIAPGTMALMRTMVSTGEHASLSRERIWRELALALCSPTPGVVFDVLHECGAAPALLPTVPADALLPGSRALRALERVAIATTDLDTRLATFIAAASDGSQPKHAESVARGMNAPASGVRAARRVQAVATALARRHGNRANDWLEAVEAGDGLRQPALFEAALPAIDALFSDGDETRQTAVRLRRVLEAAASVDTTPLTAAGLRGAAFGEALRAARLEAVDLALATQAG